MTPPEETARKMDYSEFVELLPSVDEIEEGLEKVKMECWTPPIIGFAHLKQWLDRAGAHSSTMFEILAEIILPINRLIAICGYMPRDERRSLTRAGWNRYAGNMFPLVRFDEAKCESLERLTKLLRVDHIELWSSTTSDFQHAVVAGRLCVSARGWSWSCDGNLSFQRTYFDLIRVGEEWNILNVTRSTNGQRLDMETIAAD